MVGRSRLASGSGGVGVERVLGSRGCIARMGCRRGKCVALGLI